MRQEHLFITDVKLAYSPGPTLETRKLEDLPLFTNDFDGCAVAIDQEVRTELIQARAFRTRDGRVVRIGASESVQNILRIPFEAFDDMNKEAEENWRARQRLARELAEALKPGYMKLWETFKAWKDLI